MEDILTNPIWLAILAILAVPAVTSGLTGILKRLVAATKVPAKVWVYVVSLVVTGVLLAATKGALPAWTGDPVAFVGAWLVWLAANAELARRIYEALWERLPA